MSKIKLLFKRTAYALSAIALTVTPLLVPIQASAAQITARSVTISNPQNGATGVTYAFAFSIPSSTLVKSVGFQFCDAASGTCNTPGSFAAGSAAISAGPTGLGSGGSWTSSNSANSIRILNASNTGTTAGAVTVSFNAVTNPATANSTFFIRITTYSDAAWTTPIDTGTVAATTSGLITVNANVDEALTFTLAAATVTLSAMNTTSLSGTGTSTLVASTNAGTGYTITYSSPNALKPVGGTALASYSNNTSSPGTAGFGINLATNSTPSVGSAPSGGSGAAVSPYATADHFSFVGGSVATQIASSGVASNATTYTVSYVANIAALTPPGAYTTTFSYVATPNF